MGDVPRLPKIPSVAVNRADGAALIATAREGRSATVFSELEVGWFPQNLPVVESLPSPFLSKSACRRA